MNKQPRIESLGQKKLVGKKKSMSVMDNHTGKLWSSFGPLIKTIKDKVGLDKYSLQVYPKGYFASFNPEAEFVKWALVEVSDYKDIPEGLEQFELEGGLYAVFNHKGLDMSVFQYIYSQWVPQSPYHLDDRPHFEVLGEKYKNNNPDSEEEIWIPIMKK